MKYFLAVIYTIIYQVVHVTYLVKYFGYMGYRAEVYETNSLIVTFCLILLPLRLFPKDRGYVEIVFSIIYLLLYIPIMVTLLYHYQSSTEILTTQLYFFFGFIIIFLIPRHFKPKIVGLSDTGLDYRYLLLLGAIVLAILAYNYRNSFALVSFEDVYELRSNSQTDSSLIGYLVLWNTYFLAPLIFIIGLVKRKKVFVYFGCVSIIAVYGMTGSKISLFIPMMIYGTSILIKRGKSIYKYYVYSLGGLMIAFLLIAEKFFILSAVILMRTMGIGGLLTYQYNEFFKVHQNTYLSHVNIINMFTGGYPYKQPLGFVVSQYFIAGNNNANANFWATDGIAGFGLIGVPIMSVLFGLVLVMLNSIRDNENSKIINLLIIPFSFITLNVSLFTSLVSGGLLFYIIYMILFTKRGKRSI